MAHYDCTNCGHRMRLHYGHCEKCTSQEHHKMKAELRGLIAFGEKAAKEMYREEQEVLDKEQERLNLYVKTFSDDFDKTRKDILIESIAALKEKITGK